MDQFERNLKDVLRNGPTLSLSDELRNQILRKAKRKQRAKLLMKVSLGGTFATVMTVFGFLFFSQTAEHMAALPLSNASVTRNVTHAPVKDKVQSQMTWQIAPLQVEKIESDGSTVYATIKNTGSVPLTNNQVQGILYFPAGKGTEPNPDPWYYFVDGPNEPVLPGTSATWEFHPTPVPSATGKIDRRPALVFVNRSQAGKEMAANMSWSSVNVTRRVKAVTARGDQKQYLDIEMELTNQSALPFDLKNAMAMVFFPKDPQDENLDPFTYKYFVDLSYDKSNQIAAHQKATVHLNLIAPPGVDLTDRSIHVLLTNKNIHVNK